MALQHTRMLVQITHRSGRRPSQTELAKALERAFPGTQVDALKIDMTEIPTADVLFRPAAEALAEAIAREEDRTGVRAEGGDGPWCAPPA